LAKVLDEILLSFVQKLAESEAVDTSTSARLTALFQSGKRLKADDVISVISASTRGESQ
jgi:hypothetical protein